MGASDEASAVLSRFAAGRELITLAEGLGASRDQVLLKAAELAEEAANGAVRRPASEVLSEISTLITCAHARAAQLRLCRRAQSPQRPACRGSFIVHSGSRKSCTGPSCRRVHHSSRRQLSHATVGVRWHVKCTHRHASLAQGVHRVLGDATAHSTSQNIGQLDQPKSASVLVHRASWPPGVPVCLSTGVCACGGSWHWTCSPPNTQPTPSDRQREARLKRAAAGLPPCGA